MDEKNKKFIIQNRQYQYPYHYLFLMDRNIRHIIHGYGLGIEYLTYIYFIIDKIKKIPYGKILDVGCGDGYMLNNLNDNKLKYGIDLSEKSILYARSFANDAKFEFKDLFELNEEYDIITLIEVLEHIPDDFIEKFIKKILSLIKKDGYFILSVPTTIIPLNKKHYRHYDEQLLNDHIGNKNIQLIEEFRIYKESNIFKFLNKMLSNKFYTITNDRLLSKLWQWNFKYNTYGNKSTGRHIVRVYKKIL
ncbi:MAG: class I SAM-dependent methyltransferase [bacterium]|nr:class I SAM-dependent methyltransferase [bacterium]